MDWDEIQNEFDRANAMSCKPVGMQKYKAGHIFDENMSVKWNRDKLAEENKKFQDEVARLNTLKNKAFLAVHELVYQKIQEDMSWRISRARTLTRTTTNFISTPTFFRRSKRSHKFWQAAARCGGCFLYEHGTGPDRFKPGSAHRQKK